MRAQPFMRRARQRAVHGIAQSHKFFLGLTHCGVHRLEHQRHGDTAGLRVHIDDGRAHGLAIDLVKIRSLV